MRSRSSAREDAIQARAKQAERERDAARAETARHAAEIARLAEEVAQLRAALELFRVWAVGFLRPTTGMGAGMHVEMWPLLTPSVARRMEEIAARTLLATPAAPTKTDCPTCGGDGFALGTDGMHQSESPCPTCHGRGRVAAPEAAATESLLCPRCRQPCDVPAGQRPRVCVMCEADATPEDRR